MRAGLESTALRSKSILICQLAPLAGLTQVIARHAARRFALAGRERARGRQRDGRRRQSPDES